MSKGQDGVLVIFLYFPDSMEIFFLRYIMIFLFNIFLYNFY